jgi:4-hydroxybenzoyl-CoA thioesterase/acyl-CoA thioester hydrolase
MSTDEAAARAAATAEPVHTFRTRRRVEFADTDLGGLVHFSRFFVFMETAEHELLRAIGTPVHFRHDGHELGWPRLAARCEYVSPVRYGDELEIEVRVVRKGRRAMTWGFRFACDGRLVAHGEVSSICCVLDEEQLRPVPIPARVAQRLVEAPREER